MIRYRFPFWLIASRVPSFLFARRRSLSADAAKAFRAIGATPCVSGADAIPLTGGFLLVMNHFHRTDIASWWMAMAALKAIADRRAETAPSEVRMVVANQWTYSGGWQRAIGEPFSRFLVGRIISTYNYLPMVPPELGAAASGAQPQSLRAILEAARAAKREGTPIGLAPEGGDTPGGVMIHPPIGAGRFMHLLAGSGLPFLPVGTWAEGDRIFVRFGATFHLDNVDTRDKVLVEEAVVRQVMRRIAALLPDALRGPFGVDS